MTQSEKTIRQHAKKHGIDMSPRSVHIVRPGDGSDAYVLGYGTITKDGSQKAVLLQAHGIAGGDLRVRHFVEVV